MARYLIKLIIEDNAQEQLLEGLIWRLVSEAGKNKRNFSLLPLKSRGKSIQAFKDYVQEDRSRGYAGADLLVVCSDANCKGYTKRKEQLLRESQQGLYTRVITAIPDPHVERWYLIDLSALSISVDAPISISLPSHKCAKGYYKNILKLAFRESGVIPVLGGSEYGKEIAAHMDLYQSSKSDHGLRDFIEEFNIWLTTLP